jgi:hypothetical protein
MDASTPTGDASVPAGSSGCTLRPNKDGWVALASNGAHVQGAVYTFASMGSTIVPLTTTTTPFTTGEGGKLCVKGESAKVLNMEYSKYYGAGLAFDLCQADPMVQMKYPIGQCPLGKGVVGINFKLSGATVPVELRVQFHEVSRDESTYVLAKAGQNEARFADGKVIYNATAPAVNVDKIDAIQFAIPTNEVNPTPFDFCVEDIQFVMAAGMSCANGAPTDAGTGSTGSDAGTKDASVEDSGGGTGNPNYPPITNGCNGRTTRYWDCCKPHCGVRGNVSSAFAPLTTCTKQDGALGNFDTQSACQGGTAFMCSGNAPWAVSNTLSFGYAASKSFNDVCGRCYQLQFTGQSSNGAIDPGSAAIAGKTMVVQLTNVGNDVAAGQFDLLIPGGGVGIFNACSNQWGGGDLGAQYGGFLATCKQQLGGAAHDALKNCVMQKCTSVFGAKGLTKLEAGCKWFVDWFQVADNPTIQYKEVACPQELKSRGMNRGASPGGQCIQ